VGDQMEHAHCYAASAQTYHHVTELRDGGVGEDALNVILLNCDVSC
jgi:hypothetical protein